LNGDKNWIRLRVHRTPGVRSLVLELPSSRGSDPDLLLIDTGAENGVSLSEKRWREWTQSQPANSPATIEGYQNLQEKVVGEEYLARTLKLDDFVLYNVPVVKAAPLVALGLGPRYAATLGLEALKQVDLVIDCEHGLAYVSSYAERGPWNYNRLGAVFFPADDQDHRLVARVSAQGPAALAGIHLGDELVKVNDLDLAALSAKGIPADSYWRKPAGTKLVLTLRRGGTMFSVTVVLQEIFARDSDLPKRGL
jgi:predicted metalloprotease with PDZ domain